MATFHTAIFTRDGSLGLTVSECATSSAAVVASVKPGGAAQSRRVKPGDVISKVNGRRVGGYADAARAIASAGRPLTLVLERSSQPLAENRELPPETGAAWTKSSLGNARDGRRRGEGVAGTLAGPGGARRGQGRSCR